MVLGRNKGGYDEKCVTEWLKVEQLVGFKSSILKVGLWFYKSIAYDTLVYSIFVMLVAKLVNLASIDGWW